MRIEEKITLAVLIFGLGFLGGFITPVEVDLGFPLLTYFIVIVLIAFSVFLSLKKIK